MRAALKRVRVDRVSTTAVSEATGIPTRTLRRYVNFSKDPADQLFFFEVAEESQEDRRDGVSDAEEAEEIVCWRPRTTVPMFQLPLQGSVPAPSSAPSLLHQPLPFTAAAAAAGDIGGMLADSSLFNNSEFDELFADFMLDESLEECEKRTVR